MAQEMPALALGLGCLRMAGGDKLARTSSQFGQVVLAALQEAAVVLQQLQMRLWAIGTVRDCSSEVPKTTWVNAAYYLSALDSG